PCCAGAAAGAACPGGRMRIRDLNWMQLEAYLESDDRIVLPVGSTEQHAYLSLETDNILAERASVEAAEPLGVPVLPVIAYGVPGQSDSAGVHAGRRSCRRGAVGAPPGIRPGSRRERAWREHRAGPGVGRES